MNRNLPALTKRSTILDQHGQPFALSGAWKGARRDRTQTQGWKVSAGSADEDNNDDLPTLRERSRQIYRDEALGGSAIETNVSHVVGTGLGLQAQVDRDILGWSEDRAEAWQKKVERYFHLWANNRAASLDLSLNFYQAQELIYRTVLLSGDALTNLTWRKHPGSPFSTCLQVLEGDRLSNPEGKPNTRTLVNGVELDRHGAPVRYWIQDQHPGSRLGFAKRTWTAFDAFTGEGRPAMLHHYLRERPEQHRGIPYLAPVIEAFKDLGEFTDAEIRAAVVSALSAVFITSPPEAYDDGHPLAPKEGSEDIELGYGTSHALKPGEDVKVPTPGRPNPAFDPFVLAILRQIGRRLQIPYEVLIGHFTASYSAARAALLEMGRYVRRMRYWMGIDICQPVFEAVLEELVIRKMVDAPGFMDDPLLRMAYCGTAWNGDSLGQIDMGKEVNAWADMVDRGWATAEQATTALTGGDYDRNIARRSREIKAEREAGIVPADPKALGMAQPPQPEPDPDKTDNDQEDGK